MGGVSEEQAAEAAAQQSEKVEHDHDDDAAEDVAVEGEGVDDTVDVTGTDVMEGDDAQEVRCVL